MLKCLHEQYANPIEHIIVPEGVENPSTVWIFDFISALEKANGHQFGYPDFSRHEAASMSQIGNMNIGIWCSCFLTQYFTRKSNFTTPDSALNYAAKVMSEVLCKYSADQISRLQNKTIAAFQKKEYQTSMPSHRGFEPLLALLIHEGVIDSPEKKENIRACFAEKANLTGQAGMTPVVIVKNTLIKWQTATDAGRDHKRNELSGRAVSMRYTWDNEAKRFVPRSNVKKMILLLDGTWRQKDLNALIDSGWDEIYYPDEIDKLKAAIV